MALQTTDEVAKLLGVTRGRVHQLVRQLGLQPLKQWGQLFFTATERNTLMRRKTKPGPNGKKK